jgi:hypothetical protein
MRILIVAALLALAAALPAAAQDKATPNMLTPKEIADGWILLFDGETTFGWHEISSGTDSTPAKTNVKAKDDLLMVSGTTADTFGSKSVFANFDLGFDYRSQSGEPGLTLLARDFRKMGGLGCPLSKSKEWTHFALTVKGGLASSTDGSGDTVSSAWSSPASWVTFGQGNVTLRNVKLRPLNAKPLFNGKDLTGWKVFPAKKSVFTVEDGSIVCKNGPGDLQTEAQYANFVLQLECKSNGKHLNSGVFFRCKANEYQNGYEAQIHNNFTADPAKEYTVEEYDPKTHELKEKKKVKSAAVDYGTGAIYRRVPARKQTAKDGEWFTMTIVAHGNHIATWVNGIQQVDWYDYRPASDNPRTGCRLEAGHISILGHDPTTDLSFRNIRIAELP